MTTTWDRRTGEVTYRDQNRRIGSSDQALRLATRDNTQDGECGRGDSNPYALSGTRT